MMQEIKDGGPAFPVQDASKWQCHGMTLRDYFAAKAMQGLMANSEGVHRDQEPTFDALCRDKKIANIFSELAYDMANAMLSAREVNHG